MVRSHFPLSGYSGAKVCKYFIYLSLKNFFDILGRVRTTNFISIRILENKFSNLMPKANILLRER